MRMKWSDCIALIVVVLLLGGFTIAQVVEAMEEAARVKCASNLRQIGQAMLLYSNQNRGAYPRTIASADDDPRPVWGTPYEGAAELAAPKDVADPFDPDKSRVAPRANDVTAALFLLLRTQDITAHAFVCPSTGREGWDFGGVKYIAMNWTNWPGRKGLAEHLGYSMQNPYPSKQARNDGFKWTHTRGGQLPAAADMNPGVDALLKLAPDSPREQMRKGNSPNHLGEGQNVVFGDGHVEWKDNPLAGVEGDNMYTFGANAGIVGSSTGRDDAILLPTAKDLGVIDAEGKLSDEAQQRREGIYADMKPPTDAERDAMRRRLAGIYGQGGRGPFQELQITAQKIIAFARGKGMVPWDYKITHVGDGRARLEVSAMQVLGGFLVVTLEADGISTRGSVPLSGKWTKAQ